MAQWIVVATLDRFGRRIDGAKPSFATSSGPTLFSFFILWIRTISKALMNCPSCQRIRFDDQGACMQVFCGFRILCLHGSGLSIGR